MQAFFLDAGARAGCRRFALHHAPQGLVRGSIVALYPFAEEMNKSRRMVALGARALAAAGHAVLQIDLAGCGDSEGTLETATWDGWLDDVDAAVDWLGQRYDAPLWLWGTRAGCLVAADAARRRQCGANFLFWQPQSAGKLVLQQFLRLKLASQLQQGTSKGLTDALLGDLALGRSVEVAGYRLGAALAQGLGASALLPPPAGSRLCWLEVSTREPLQLLPAAAPVLAAWAGAGFDITSQAVAGPPFWQTLEIEDAPSLVDLTARVVAP